MGFPPAPPASSCSSRWNCILSALQKDRLTGGCSLVLSCHAGIEPRTLCTISKLAVTEPQPWPGNRFLVLDPRILFCLPWTSWCVDSNFTKELGDPARSGTNWNFLAHSDLCYVFDTSLELLTLLPWGESTLGQPWCWLASPLS